MQYPPKIHQDDNREHILEVIKTFPLATLISVNQDKPVITHLPLIWNGEKLVGHIDKFNPQAEFLRAHRNITVIFSGPECYISPSIYNTEQLPTWNYVKVHLQGTVTEIESQEAIKQSMISMTEFLEAPEQKYMLHPDNPDMEKYLPFVKGFEIKITAWEGKFKLSQNRNKQDFEAAKKELIRRTQESIRRFLDSILN